MHEVAIMENVLDMAIEQARLAGGTRVHVVHLRVGTLSGVVREALEFACDAVVQGTMAAGMRLVVETVEAAGWCANCRAEFPCDDFFFQCPRCRTWTSELRRGRELELSRVEIS